ncbi:hypothetical protein FOTG_18951 [Fusarium oxysporum f. sp. vasinfectum 25433]|uniref:Uncharacterized protein n=1 Tax=Fusarium oxysporum f. sp. vasinfectum 25433 TaxID=1089449 RepID=X0KUS4_FUSOX|nr:hypothetical protein FOTG_18951 [Fusarium oxysporum f. sp. vasinfectum 25433]
MSREASEQRGQSRSGRLSARAPTPLTCCGSGPFSTTSSCGMVCLRWRRRNQQTGGPAGSARWVAI